MFKHTHPYDPFLFEGVTKLIVGTLPPPRFTTGELQEEDVDFCYGSKNGQLWPILNTIFNLKLHFQNTALAIEQRMLFLKARKIGVCDIVASAERSKIDASDVGMQNVVLRDLMFYLAQYPSVETLLFTGGNSKNGPEYFFRKIAKEQHIVYTAISKDIPRVHQFIHPSTNRIIKTVSLTAPSGAANRAVGSLESYKMLKKGNPQFNTFDFRVMQYKEYF